MRLCYIVVVLVCRTPNMERLALEGMKLTQHSCCAALHSQQGGVPHRQIRLGQSWSYCTLTFPVVIAKCYTRSDHAYLERLNLKENTLVYMTSDQRPHLEEISIHREMHGGYSGIYKGILSKGLSLRIVMRASLPSLVNKASHFSIIFSFKYELASQPTGKVGFGYRGFFQGPGVLPAGKVTDEPSSNMDIFPMVLNLSGASIPSDRLAIAVQYRVIDGHDLFPLLQGQVKRSEHEFMPN
ncbi:hypothetical protein cypCar_00011111 [Cyprinus carpio]|nr:hypothetical protein cypCar_00011111 [Cyprinus carpio]